jgi:hypothetical protein
MAKLTARGRTIVWRIVKEDNAPKSDLITWEKEELSLMTDGSILRRSVVEFKPGPYDHGKPQRHDYGWKEYRKLKAGGDPQRLLESFKQRGYKVDAAPGLATFDAEAYAKKRTQQVSQQSKGRERRKTARATAVAPGGKDGPGFYIRNRYLSEMKPFVAELGPYDNLDTAIEHAIKRWLNFVDMKFDYLLPVQIVEGKNRSDAERQGIFGNEKAHVFWEDGKMKGPPVSEKQLRLV